MYYVTFINDEPVIVVNIKLVKLRGGRREGGKIERRY